MNVDRALNGLLKLAIAGAVIASGALAVVVVLDHMTLDRQATERRALTQRNAELNISAVAPGSVLACLDGGAGEAVENACEKQVFADPQRAAAATTYMAARLALLADVAALAHSEPAVLEGFAATRRAIELDRYGIAAHVLAVRDGCTAEQCAAFAWLGDTTALKANLKAQIYDQYVSRYAAAWNKEPEKQVPVAGTAAPAPVAAAPEAPTGVAVSSKYDFPSAASIPPVSIMNAEPPLPKGAASPTAPQAKSDKADDAAVPVPPKRPQTQAASPPSGAPQPR
jgi:hypothetical protein